MCFGGFGTSVFPEQWFSRRIEEFFWYAPGRTGRSFWSRRACRWWVLWGFHEFRLLFVFKITN